MDQESVRWVLHSTVSGAIVAGQGWSVPGIIEVQNFDGDRPIKPDCRIVLSEIEFQAVQSKVARLSHLTLRSPTSGDENLAQSKTELSSIGIQADELRKEITRLESDKATLLADIEGLKTQLMETSKNLDAEQRRLEAVKADTKKGGRRKRTPRKKDSVGNSK